MFYHVRIGSDGAINLLADSVIIESFRTVRDAWRARALLYYWNSVPHHVYMESAYIFKMRRANSEF